MDSTGWWKGRSKAAGQPISVAHGTPPRNYQHLLEAGTPLDFRAPYERGTNSSALGREWTPGARPGTSPAGPSMLPWQQPSPAGGDGVSLMSEFGGGGGSGGMAGIRTSIVPRPIYSPEQTLAGTNLAVAEQHAAGSLPSIMKQFDSQGISRGAAHVARALPIQARARQSAARTRAQLPMEDALANARAMLTGENARENEAIQLANLGLRLRGNEQDYFQSLARQRLGNAGSALSMVDSLFG